MFSFALALIVCVSDCDQKAGGEQPISGRVGSIAVCAETGMPLDVVEHIWEEVDLLQRMGNVDLENLRKVAKRVEQTPRARRLVHVEIEVHCRCVKGFVNVTFQVKKRKMQQII